MADDASLLARYVELKRTVRELQAEIEALNEAIYSQVQASGGRLAGPDYTISCSRRTHYRFSAAHEQRQAEIDRLQTQLKELEDQEIQSGEAAILSTTNIVSVRFD